MYDKISKNLLEDDEVAGEEVEESNDNELELLKERLQELADAGDSMTKEVLEDQIDEIDGYDSAFDFIRHLTDLGISGGGVSSMIYYADTLNFAESYAEEINERLSEKMSEYGSTSLEEFFGENYDETDPLNIGQTNRNLFAWWAYEDVCRDAARELNEEYHYGADDYI